MRKFCFSLLLLSVGLVVEAEPVDVAEAMKIAERLVNKNVKEVVLAAESHGRTIVVPFESPAFYVFEASDGKGFAIVSGDDEFPEVIGYSDKSNFSAGNMPEGLMAYLEMYSHYVAEVRSGNAEAPEVKDLTPVGTPVVNPLCEAQWGQGAPFYNMCPLIGVRRCYVGCVATAMAQIMYYYKFPERAKGVVNYDTGNPQIGRNGILTVNLNTPTHIYDWASMKNTTEECSATKASRDAVAQLSYDCGVASHMMYGVEGSGTSDIDACYALYTNFNYSKSSVSYMSRSFFDNQAEWEALIKHELDEKRPVFYAGASSTGGGADAAGHAFVIDGYDSNGFVHVNWGWDGDCDGYYDIVKLNPEGYTFSIDQSAIIGIKPGEEGEKRPQSRLLAIWDGSMEAEDESCNVGSMFVVALPEFYNFEAVTKTWYIGVGLYDKYGNFIQKVSVGNMSETIKSYYGDDGYPVRCVIPAKLNDGKQLTDGDYALRMIINEDGYTNALGGKDWVLPYCYGGDKKNWYPVMVEDGVLYFGQVSSGIEDVEFGSLEVVSSECFDLNGYTVDIPRKGQIVVERQTLRNGKQRSVKRVF